jgi:hypothetical protein
MAVETGYQTPTHNIVVAGRPQIIDSMKLGAGIYSGNLVAKGTTDVDAVLADGVKPAIGWVGFEQANIHERPDNMTSVWSTGSWAPVMIGKEFVVYANMAAGFKGDKGDKICSFSNGQVAPCEIIEGVVSLKIPFGKSTAELSTGIVLPAGVLVQDCVVRVDTAVAGAAIDVGMLSSEANGDANGLLAQESCVNAGKVAHVTANTTLANLTVGALISTPVKSADASAVYSAVFKNLKTDGVSKTISYTTTNHSIAGYIFVVVNSAGMQVKGILGQSVDATAAATGCFVECD